MQLSELGLDSNLYRSGQDSSVEDGAISASSNVSDAPSTSISSGNGVFDVNTNAQALKAGQDTYDSGKGYFLGYSNGYYKLSIGDSAGQKLLWDGINLSITGNISATTGTIGGFTIGATNLSATSGGNTTIISSGGTAFSSGPTDSPTVTITQAGVINATGGSINGATITGGIIQTSAATNVDRIIISGAHNAIEFWNSGNELSASLTTLTYSGTGLLGVELKSGGGAFLSIGGKSNEGTSMIGVTPDADNMGYAQVTWDGGDVTSSRLELVQSYSTGVRALPIGSNLIPYGTKELGSAADPFRPRLKANMNDLDQFQELLQEKWINWLNFPPP